jgi:hypothetical protein
LTWCCHWAVLSKQRRKLRDRKKPAGSRLAPLASQVLSSSEEVRC